MRQVGHLAGKIGHDGSVKARENRADGSDGKPRRQTTCRRLRNGESYQAENARPTETARFKNPSGSKKFRRRPSAGRDRYRSRSGGQNSLAAQRIVELCPRRWRPSHARTLRRANRRVPSGDRPAHGLPQGVGSAGEDDIRSSGWPLVPVRIAPAAARSVTKQAVELWLESSFSSVNDPYRPTLFGRILNRKSFSGQRVQLSS